MVSHEIELELELILSRWLWERGEKSGASLQKQARVFSHELLEYCRLKKSDFSYNPPLGQVGGKANPRGCSWVTFFPRGRARTFWSVVVGRQARLAF